MGDAAELRKSQIEDWEKAEEKCYFFDNQIFSMAPTSWEHGRAQGALSCYHFS